MTIGNITPRVSFDTDGVTKIFPVPIQGYLAGDFEVIITTATGVQFTLVLNSDYSMAPSGTLQPQAWTLTTLAAAALAADQTLQVFINPVQTQQSQYVQGQAFPSLAVQTNLDRLTQMVQRLQDQLNRTVLAPDGDVAPGMELPPAQLRALTYQAYDAAGNTLCTPALPGTANTAASLGPIINPRTPFEIAYPVTPTFYIYIASPRIDPRRYDVVGDGVTDDTAAFQLACSIAQAQQGRLLLPQNFNILTFGVALTFNGSRNTLGFSIEGAGPNSSLVTQKGAPAAGVFSFLGATPAGAPTECQMVLENFTVCQPANAQTADGIVFNNLANFRLSNVVSRGFINALHLKSSLIVQLDQGCQFNASEVGVNIESNGVGGSTCNLISISQCKMLLNSNWGTIFGNGSQLMMRDNDIEGNGTSNNVNTGAIRILANLAPDSLVAGVLLERNWIENGVGSGILVDAPTGGVATTIVIRGGNILAQEAGRSITVNGATKLRVEDIDCATPGDTFVLTAGQAIVENIRCSTLTDGGITTPNYRNVTTSAGFFALGRVDTSVVLTLTGVTGTVTVNPKIIQQGDLIRMVLPDLLGVSTTTSCTITGLAAKYAPAGSIMLVAVTENNSADSPQNLILAAGGTFTLTVGGSGTGFAVGGNKGLRECNLEWRL